MEVSRHSIDAHLPEKKRKNKSGPADALDISARIYSLIRDLIGAEKSISYTPISLICLLGWSS